MNCYSETTNPRALSTLFTSTASMTIDTCAALAQAANLQFFGLEYSSQCLGGSTIRAESSILAASKCNMKCSGDTTQTCGGSNAISLYNNTLYVKPTNPNPVNVPNQPGQTYAYTGCFSEPTGARALGSTAQFGSYATSSNSMTVEACAALCFAKGYAYMGVENGKECYCNGAGVINGAALSAGGDADCSTTCGGNPRENCGGLAKINVYQMKTGSARFGSKKTGGSRRDVVMGLEGESFDF
jgi:hypothetical protein